MSTYKIVQKIDDKFVITRPTNIYSWCDVNDRRYEALSPRRQSALRAELRDAPRIEGMVGPFYDSHENGVAVVRYEDQRAFDELSN